MDTFAHDGSAPTGEFTRSVNLTDVHTGRALTQAICNNARAHALAAVQPGIETILYLVNGLDFDNGSELINHDVIN